MKGIVFALFIGMCLCVSSLSKAQTIMEQSERIESNEFIDSAKLTIGHKFVGNLALASIKNGIVENEIFHSAGKQVDRNTIFQVAFLSKWICALRC